MRNTMSENNKVLLVNAPYINVYGPVKLAAGRYFPLGLGYIASVLLQSGFNVKLLDPEAQKMTLDDIEKIVEEWKPFIVGISSATPNFASVLGIVRLVKKVNPHIVTVAGGIHVTALPEFVLRKNEELDIVAIGEAEYTMLELCLASRNGFRSYDSVRGIAYRRDDKIVFTKPRPLVQDPDTLPFPARHLIDLNLFYPNLFNTRRRRSAGIITSRGCPFKCYFCASNLTMGSRYRPHSASRVFDEISMLVRNHNVEQILFFDDTFTLQRQRVVDICEHILRSGIKVDWHCFGRVSDVDQEMLKLMEKAGCSSIGYGVESGNAEVLKSIKKGITIEQVRRAFAMTNKTNMRIQAFFVFGNKKETKENMNESIKLSKELKPHLAFFNMLTPYPGTPAFKDIGIGDLDEIANWEDFVAIGPKASIKVGMLSKKELLDGVHRAHRDFYLRPKQLIKILFSFRTFYEFTRYVKGGVALILQILNWREKSKQA